MKNSTNSTLWSIIIMAIPFIYLGMVWSTIPDTIATHFNIKGEADAFGSKNTLIYISLVLMLPTFLILEFVPRIDPKKKIQTMGMNYEKFKLLLIIFLAGLALYIIHIAVSGGDTKMNLLYAIIGLFFMAFGNYLPTVKPNYFIGIRTPWTLENETVWRKTHRIGGKIFMFGGLLVALFSLLAEPQVAFYVLMGFSFLATMGCLVYSYLEFQKIA